MMRKKQIVTALLTFFVLAALLAGCSSQPTPQPAPAETQIQTLPEVINPYPQDGGGAAPTAAAPSGGAYPAAGGDPQAAPASAAGDGSYPGIADGSEIFWEQALTLLQNGQVVSVSQRHDLTVTLSLKDGRTLTVLEPAIDAILQAVQECGAPCSQIQVATE